jgi:hypothetical protein
VTNIFNPSRTHIADIATQITSKKLAKSGVFGIHPQESGRTRIYQLESRRARCSPAVMAAKQGPPALSRRRPRCFSSRSARWCAWAVGSHRAPSSPAGSAGTCASLGRGQHLRRQTLWLRSVAGLAAAPCRVSLPLRKGLRVRLRPRKWTTEPTRRPPGVAMWDGGAGSEQLSGGGGVAL